MSKREYPALVTNCPSFITEPDPAPEDYVWTADSEADDVTDYNSEDDTEDDAEDYVWQSECDCEMCREEFWEDEPADEDETSDDASQTAECTEMEEDLRAEIDWLTADAGKWKQQSIEDKAKISDLTETLNVQLNYSDEIWRLQNQLTESQSSSQTAWNEHVAFRQQIDYLKQQLKAQVIYSDVQLESCRNYLNQTWTESAKWWKGFDLYLFGVWISLRKTPDGWKLKSGSRSVE